jgi:hypothetical protein
MKAIVIAYASIRKREKRPSFEDRDKTNAQRHEELQCQEHTREEVHATLYFVGLLAILLMLAVIPLHMSIQSLLVSPVFGVQFRGDTDQRFLCVK